MNYPIWFNFIYIGNSDYLLEMVMHNKVRAAYIFAHNKKNSY